MHCWDLLDENVAPASDVPIQMTNRSLFEVSNLCESVFITNNKNKIWNIKSNNRK